MTYQIKKYDNQYTTQFVLILTWSSGHAIEVATATRDKPDGGFVRSERREVNWAAIGASDIEVAEVFATGLADLVAQFKALE